MNQEEFKLSIIKEAVERNTNILTFMIERDKMQWKDSNIYKKEAECYSSEFNLKLIFSSHFIADGDIKVSVQFKPIADDSFDWDSVVSLDVSQMLFMDKDYVFERVVFGENEIVLSLVRKTIKFDKEIGFYQTNKSVVCSVCYSFRNKSFDAFSNPYQMKDMIDNLRRNSPEVIYVDAFATKKYMDELLKFIDGYSLSHTEKQSLMAAYILMNPQQSDSSLSQFMKFLSQMSNKP